MDQPDRAPRLPAIDTVRGLVMGLMVLDHVRDFLHAGSRWGDPTDLRTAGTALFLTRWVTHLCAPIFALLAGVSIHLLERRRTPAELRRFLVTRGLWLILCEFTLVRVGMSFHWDAGFLGLAQVIWVLGVSMLLMAFLVARPWAWRLAFGLLLVAGHNLLDAAPVTGWFRSLPASEPLWILLHQGGALHPLGSGGPVLLVLYPLLPWPGIMALGYALGPLFDQQSAFQRRLLLGLGGACVVAFVALRLWNGYGDPGPWTMQETAHRTLLSFLNTEKYPPSLLFTLMTVGPGLLLLAAWTERANDPLSRVLATFGKVPLFFYLLQWPTAQLLGIFFHRLADRPPIQLFGAPSMQSGFHLGWVYAAWLAALLILYPLCRWFAGVKVRRRDGWLTYL